MGQQPWWLLCFVSITSVSFGGEQTQTASKPICTAFGHGGQIKMLYDRRQRPQSLYMHGKVYIVFNAGAAADAPPKAHTRPMGITYDPRTREFSDVVTIAHHSSRDHHKGPVIWPDNDDRLHILYGCHRTPGTHLVAKEPGMMPGDPDVWQKAPRIARGISYPTLHKIYDDKQLIYYRTHGHFSSWTYRISDDNGMTWTGPVQDVTDMDSQGRPEWSSYQTTIPSRDGTLLHVVFFSYDDVKSNDPRRLYNPRYDQPVSNEWKYNLYYLRIDLQSHAVTNFDGETLTTPVDIDQADARCRIWDTDWRGAGVPPTISLDKNGDPEFLHVLSEDSLTRHRYYYVRRVGGKWKQTPITDSNHQWNSCHLTRSAAGDLRAYVVVGDGYFDTGRYMDRYGGGSIEEWTSEDEGNTWQRHRDLTPDTSQYPNWKFNNIQPVVRRDGSHVDGMLLFYGWSGRDRTDAKAFLLHEPHVRHSATTTTR